MSRLALALNKTKITERQEIDSLYIENTDLKVQEVSGWQQEQAGAGLDQAWTRWENLLKTANQEVATPHSPSEGAR